MSRYLAIAAGVLVLLLGGAGLLLKRSYENNGTLQAQLADRDAVIRQKASDAALSARLVAQQNARLTDLQARAATAIQQVYHEPTQTNCAQSLPMRDATRSLHRLFDGGGEPPAGRQPAAALH